MKASELIGWVVLVASVVTGFAMTILRRCEWNPTT